MYYRVWVVDKTYHGQEALTYTYSETLQTGQLVTVTLRNRPVFGIVDKRTTKPKGMSVKTLEVPDPHLKVPAKLLELQQWLKAYYPAPGGLITQLFLPPMGSFYPSELPSTEVKSATLPALTNEQAKALRAIQLAPKSQMVILHGDTGTGKTRVYLELAQSALKSGESAIILVPEIGLTPQLSQVFERMFPGQIVVLHSNLTPAQRRKAWNHIATAKTPLVIIGPRSALFAPLAKIGLIVMDEFHDNSYKQEQAPYYLTTRVAAKLASLHKARCIFGSATPPVSDYYLIKEKGGLVLRMRKLANPKATKALSPTLVDATDKAQFTVSRLLSKPLIAALSQRLNNGEQSLLFLNRRGTARLILCQECGWQASCPRCDIPLTYHHDFHQLQCHTCGHRQSAPTACPECNSSNIIYQSAGTKAVVDELYRLFPDALIGRFDSDNKKSEKLERQYERIMGGEIDILVGTQVLSKGLDIPKLTLVGIVSADSSLYFPDFSAEEQTYQMLAQVMGRVGRTHRPSEVIIQSYTPKNPTLLAALKGSWLDFYKAQLGERQQFGFPPFNHFLKLQIKKARRETCKKSAAQLAERLSRTHPGVRILGPAPCFNEKAHGQYRWQIIVQSKDRSRLIKIIQDLPSGWVHNLDPTNLL